MKLFFLLIILISVNVFSDDFDTLRLKWKEMITGGNDYNPLDSNIALKIAAIDSEAQSYWISMDTSATKTTLWSDLPVINYTTDKDHGYNMKTIYLRIRAMTLAYSTKGSTLNSNSALFNDISKALDWAYSNLYYPGVSSSSWIWMWEMGAPLALNDIMTLLYDKLTPAQIADHSGAVLYYSSPPYVSDPTDFYGATSTGANRTDRCKVIALHGIIVKDSNRIRLAANKLTESAGKVFYYTTSSDGFYRDGSFIQHNYFAQTGSYGRVLLDGVAYLLTLLKDSRFEVSDPIHLNMYNWIYDSYEPLFYKGGFMSMVSERSVAHHVWTEHYIGHAIMNSIFIIGESANSTDATAYNGMLKYWISTDTYKDFIKESAPIYTTVKIRQMLANTSIQTRKYIGCKVFANMDRVVLQRPDFGFGISLYSTRTRNFETTSLQNLRGWHKTSGMTYLYNEDIDHFSDDYWPTVDAFRLPGITLQKATTIPAYSPIAQFYGPYNGDSWAGGATMSDTFGVCGIKLKPAEQTLTANKSWFLFDNEIVALGSGITSADGKGIETIVENRMLRTSGDNALTVNGSAKSTALGWQENMDSVSWAHLEGNVTGSDIGYYFPDKPSILGFRQQRTGKWSDINKNTGNFPPTDLRTRNYMHLIFEHGVDPTDAYYAYVILPNLNASAVETYASNPDITILANSKEAHCVRENNLGITAANFWNNNITTAGEIACNKKASVLIRENTGSSIQIAVSDPTHSSTSIKLDILKRANSVISNDANITVVQMAPTIKLSVNVDGKKGKTFSANLGLSADPVGMLYITVKDSLSGELLSDVVTTASGMYNQTDTSDTNGNVVFLTDSGENFVSIRKPAYAVKESLSVNVTDTTYLNVFLTPLSVTGIRILPEDLTVGQHTDYNLTAVKIYSDNAADTLSGGITWYVRTGGIVAVDSNGRISTGEITGSATVVCSSHVYGFTDTAVITVEQKFVLNPIDDAYVRGGVYRTDNFGIDSILVVKKGSLDLTRESYLKFDLSSIGNNQIYSALLKLYLAGTNTVSGVPVTVYGVDNDTWTEENIIWDNKPATGSALDAVTLTDSDSQSYVEWDVTAFAQTNFLLDSLLSLCLKDPSSADKYFTFTGKEAYGHHPVLEVIAAGTTGCNDNNDSKVPLNVIVCPNPFNPVVSITINGMGMALNRKGMINHAPTIIPQIAIYDITGRCVYKVYIEPSNTTTGIIWNASKNPSGLYIAHIKIGDKTFKKKLVLIK